MDEKQKHENNDDAALRLVMAVELLIQETRINHRILILAIAVIGAGKEFLGIFH